MYIIIVLVPVLPFCGGGSARLLYDARRWKYRFSQHREIEVSFIRGLRPIYVCRVLWLWVILFVRFTSLISCHSIGGMSFWDLRGLVLPICLIVCCLGGWVQCSLVSISPASRLHVFVACLRPLGSLEQRLWSLEAGAWLEGNWDIQELAQHPYRRERYSYISGRPYRSDSRCRRDVWFYSLYERRHNITRNLHSSLNKHF